MAVRLTQPGRTPRALIYVRQSTYREESISLELQEHICREHAKRSGYEVVRVEADPGISGRTWQRRGVQAAMAALEEHAADVVVLWKWSRLSRNRRDWAVAADRADLAGGRIESATEPIDTNSAAGRFQRGMMVEMAAFESDRIGEVWSETHAYRIRNGLPPTGGHRFGYTRDSEGNYHPDPETGPLLADLYRWYLSGLGSAAITKRMNDLGVYTRDKPWSYQSMMRMLDSGFGAGLLGRTTTRNGRRFVPRPWDRTYEPGAHQPVIDRPTWDAYVAARRRRFRMPTRTARRYLLTGLMRCGDCGGPMSGKVFNGRPTYVCSRSTTTNGMRRVTIVAWRVEKLVEEWLFTLASEVDARAAAVQQTAVRRDRAEHARETVRRDLAKADARLVKLALRLADGTLNETTYRLASEKVEADRAALEARMSYTIINPVEEAAPVDLPTDLVALWPSMTTDEKSGVLRPLLRTVTVYPAAHRGATDREVTIAPAWAN